MRTVESRGDSWQTNVNIIGGADVRADFSGDVSADVFADRSTDDSADV